MRRSSRRRVTPRPSRRVASGTAYLRLGVDIAVGGSEVVAQAASESRHKDNSSTNLLYADGHGESKAIGEVKRRELLINRY